MNDVGPVIGKENLFEKSYREKFRSLVSDFGLFVQYEQDLASIDLGLHLTTSSNTEGRVSRTRIWFQLKGIHKETLPTEDYRSLNDVSVPVMLHHLKFWFASPEPIYLAVYVEAADKFLVEDVRELVYRKWGDRFLTPGTFPEDQHTATVKLRTEATLTPERVELMRRHQSMRIDGPFFRGRPLGHRLDPLRCSLERMEPAVYVCLVQRLLSVHAYRLTEDEELDPAVLFAGDLPTDEHAALTTGRLFNTYEWVPYLLTEFGVGSTDDFRSEGTPQFAQGPAAVFIHGDPRSHPCTDSLRDFARCLKDRGIRRLLVFANTDDYAYFGSFFGGCRGTEVECVPQLLGDLPSSLLTATAVYLEFREAITWKIVNYL